MSNPGSGLRYLLITAAQNEEAFIELTINSVISQTVLPERWLIVSDGSTDRTDEIVDRYAHQYHWIELLRMPERQTRDFGGKARSFNLGYSRLQHLPHDVVVSLDADITFGPDYFEFLLSRFVQDPQLGLAGTPFSENGITYDYRFTSVEHVSGACQAFRRECMADLGGYTPVKGGGIDSIAVLTARSKGWRTRTFTERSCFHHRPMGSASHKRKLMANFRFGQKSYRLGYHPLWQIFRSVYQMTRKPYVLGAFADSAGYFWAMLCRMERSLSTELVAFQRRDQMTRLRRFLGVGWFFAVRPRTPRKTGATG
jgi:glycosyltransferase involved in cell wall biosynthesis